MKFVQGPTLSAFLDAQQTTLPEREAAEIARKLALGVAAAHARGVVHRDLKPGNVLVDEATGEVLVTDFGLARVAGESRRTAPGAVMGTPAYMAPEQARGDVEAIGPVSDVYALGVIFYRLLTGESVFRGTADEVIAQALAAEPRPPASLRPGLDARLNDLCLRALAKNPTDRPASAARFADELGVYLGLPLEKRPGGDAAETRTTVAPPRVATGRATRRRRYLALSAILLVPTGLGLWFGTGTGWGEGQTSGQEPEKAVVPPDPAQPLDRTTPTPPRGTGHRFDQAAERRAAEWVLKSGGVLGVVPTGGTSGVIVRDTGSLPPEFRVDACIFRNNGLVTDDAIRQHLTDLAGPLHVELYQCARVTDGAVKALAAVRGLEKLLLHGQTGVTDAGVAYLAGHGNLRELALDATGVTDAVLPHLETLQLTHLSLWGLPVTDEWLERVGRIRTLDNINLSRTRSTGRITPRGLAHLQNLNRLSGLILADTAIDREGLRELARLPALQTLVLQGTSVRDADLSVLGSFPRLTALRLENTRVTDAGMPALVTCSQLVEVNVVGTTVGDEGARVLAGKPTLRRVFLDRTPVTDRGIKAVAELPELEEVGFLETGITDDGLEALAGCPGLRQLAAGSKEVTDRGVEHLRRLRRIEVLGLWCPRVTDQSVEVLAGLSTLRLLDLAGTGVSTAGRVRLRNTLRRCSVLPFPPLDP